MQLLSSRFVWNIDRNNVVWLLLGFLSSSSAAASANCQLLLAGSVTCINNTINKPTITFLNSHSNLNHVAPPSRKPIEIEYQSPVHVANEAAATAANPETRHKFAIEPQINRWKPVGFEISHGDVENCWAESVGVFLCSSPTLMHFAEIYN